MNNKEISRRLNELIKRSGYSFKTLEKMTGISKSALQRYSQGSTKKIPIDVIAKIANVTNESIDSIINNKMYIKEMQSNATGKSLKYFRKKANLTQKDVAKSMSKSQQWVSDTENGVSNLLWDDIKKLCALYKITPLDVEQKEKEYTI